MKRVLERSIGTYVLILLAFVVALIFAFAPSETSSVSETAVYKKVTRVIDGDTIELEDGSRIRYIGIDTPETVDPDRPVECFGKAASERNKKLVDGRTVRLEKDISETDRYGRLLRYVYVDDVLINLSLVEEGYAYAYTYPPDVAFAERFTEAERIARENDRGLWAACSSENAPSSPYETDPHSTCVIKGNISTSGERIYHVPGCDYYADTSIDEDKGERWFCAESDAIDAGWRKAQNCSQ